MQFTATDIDGVVVVDLDLMCDERGAFARLHCPDEFAAAGHPFVPQQTSLSRNARAGTLRGMHYEAAPHEEAKLVRVVRGRIFDVAVDLRSSSPTYRRWTGTELSAQSGRALLIGKGMAHGFITLEDDTDVLYQIDRIFEPGHGRGVRWNDPAFGIEWPATPLVISERDAGYRDHDAAS
ncbi:dTDP-4-dehydrorhamnose 3,5-epimerase [Phenylobacterium sp. Root77]|uniref:dTDP-4-dehydrorhamnose 3,5-epimerase family protein n=1 Tax=unclassified Phenylobacterium TaxID=2640670 RepID=UPI0006F89734|nr:MULTISPECIES: dTDP-4-dehydrorhamnose 3,5-epimerase family protein [unclassified Phenylobacterium]KQW70797.1 dTDP-4-dehydrorhamnose 3,5-epimerase [Phenylobacterium sp. Root1277]KQW90780.1 dTDP-4-dehydrorhamnose 3,5-epimerase [Phenylobacterium sp. Root1290]KRC39587.1 dTDP-4-dehydrorhamnose 3,5-epimerase [Phenylobacterium sp. Root77]